MPTSRAAMHVRTLARPSKPFSGCRKAPSKFHIAHALKTGVNQNVPEPCWWPKHQQAGFVAPGFSAIHAKKPQARPAYRDDVQEPAPVSTCREQQKAGWQSTKQNLLRLKLCVA